MMLFCLCFCLFSFPKIFQHLVHLPKTAACWPGVARWPRGHQTLYWSHRLYPSQYLGKDLTNSIIKNSGFRTWWKTHKIRLAGFQWSGHRWRDHPFHHIFFAGERHRLYFWPVLGHVSELSPPLLAQLNWQKSHHNDFLDLLLQF